MYEQFMKLAKIDITTQPMEVAPTIHYAMGGVRVDPETGANTVAGLFAAGEVASGLHGANRLGGNSLSDLLVFGKRAGEAAAEAIKRSPRTVKAKIDRADVEKGIATLVAPLDRSAGESPCRLQTEIQDVLPEHAPIVRDGPRLEAGLGKIRNIGERAHKCGTGGSATRAFNPGWHTAHDARSMLLNAEALLLSALESKESRGAHARSDYPKTSDQLGRVNFVVNNRPDGMRVRPESIPAMPEHLQAVLQRSYVYTPEEME